LKHKSSYDQTSVVRVFTCEVW